MNLPNRLAHQSRTGFFLRIALYSISTIVATILFACDSQLHDAKVDCRSTDTALAYWRPIKARSSEVDLPVDQLALELVPCLGSLDPELRDQIGYELFTQWLRDDRLDDSTRKRLVLELSELMGNHAEQAVLSRSFSALILAELLRTDVQKPFLSAQERAELLDNAINALKNEQDFRGLDANIGWIHPIAHNADLLWRFALHPETTATQVQTILLGVESKIAPTNTAYTFNESDRLARAISTAIRRDLLNADVVATWIEQFAKPKSMQTWSDAFKTPAGMAELHNTKQFLRALSDQLSGDDLDVKISKPLNALVVGFTQLI